MSELGKVLDLLQGAVQRYRSVRASFQWNGHIWTATFAPPDRMREEYDDRVHVQWGPNWWKREGEGPAETGRGYGMSSLGRTPVSDLFNPAPIVSDAHIAVLGPRTAAGREAIAIEITPREPERKDPDEWVYEPEEVVVEAERGIVLRRTSLSERNTWIELTDVAFDVDVEGVFEPPPGVDVRPWEPPASGSWNVDSLEEAARAVSFPVFEPARLPEGSQLAWCLITPGPQAEVAAYWSCGFGHRIWIRQGPAIRSAEGREHVSEGIEISRGAFTRVLVEKDEVGVVVDSDVGEEICIGIARSLRPIPR